MNLVLDKISILEWYDGIVRALGFHQRQAYWIALAAWDMSDNRKAYIIVETDRDLADTTVDQFCKSGSVDSKNQLWEALRSSFDEFISSYRGTAYLMTDKLVAGETLTCRMVDTANLKTLLRYDLSLKWPYPFGLIQALKIANFAVDAW